MTSKTLVFAGLMAAIVSNNSMATGENTVTSKSYVDAQDALKQNKIPATGTNASTPGDTVVTYTSTAGTIGERGIFNSETGYDNDGGIDEDHENDLVPAGEMSNYVGHALDNFENSLEPVRVVKTTCANSPTCTLWEMQDVIVHKISNSDSWECLENTDCSGGKRCEDHQCVQGNPK